MRKSTRLCAFPCEEDPRRENLKQQHGSDGNLGLVPGFVCFFGSSLSATFTILG